MKYPVNDVYRSIQGEGCLAGTPMTILRLQGCGVGCPWCDTKETWALDTIDERKTLPEVLGKNSAFAWADAYAIASLLTAQHLQSEWILLTGGEPARYALAPLVSELHRFDLKVALETSGTETGHVDAGLDWVCVSPKIAMPGGKLIQAAAVACADEIKMVIGKRAHVDQLDCFLDTYSTKDDVTICLQPLSTNLKATQLCIQICQERGYRLSIQLHKYLNLP